MEQTTANKPIKKSNRTRLHYLDLLSITTGKCLSQEGMDGLYQAFDALAGPGVTTLAIIYLSKPLKSIASERYPTYATPKVLNLVNHYLDLYIQKKISLEEVRTKLATYVLPLVGEEYIEVEHLDEDTMDQLLKGYPEFLEEQLKDKDIMVAHIVSSMASALREAAKYEAEHLDEKVNKKVDKKEKVSCEDSCDVSSS